MSKNTVIPGIAAALLLAAAAFPAGAQKPPAKPLEPPSGKIGFVNPNRVMHESVMTRKLKQALEDKYAKLTKEIEAGPKERIETRLAALNDEMNVEREDALRQYVDRTNRIIRQVAIAENLDVVFLEAAFFAKHIDLTDKVIKELDAAR